MIRKVVNLLTIILFSFTGRSQNNIIGKIITADGQPAAQVNVELKDEKQNTTSNEKGYFSLSNIVNGKHTLLVSFVGLQSQEKIFQLNDFTDTLYFILKENAQQLDEVIIRSKKGLNTQHVSIGKISIDPMELPQSIAVISQGCIADQQSQRLSDIIKNVNGVYLSNTRGATQESFSARGYSFSSSNMFKNGSRISSGTMPEVSSLEKVEVLKGSAAILYGNVAPGGIINMVTKQPKFKYGAGFSVRTGSFGLIKPAVDLYGPVSKKIAFRVTGTYEKTDSYRDQVRSKRLYINPSILFKINKRTELLIQGDHLDHNFTPDFGIGSLANTIIPDLPRSAFFGTSWQYNKARQSTTAISLKNKINDSWNLNVSGSYQLYKRDYYSTEKIQATLNGDWGRALNRIQSQETYLIAQADITGKFSTGKLNHTLLAGIDADSYSTFTYGFNNPKIYDSINILDPDKFISRTDIPAASKITRISVPVNRTGLYVQDLLSISSKIKLLAGIRWSQQHAGAATTFYLINDSTATGKSKVDAAFSPRIGIVYKLRSATSLFASYSNSFSINSGTDIAGNALAPSIINQYEAGIKNDFLKGKLSTNLTFYRIINNNLAQTAQYDSSGAANNNTSLKEFAGQTTSDGIELDISGEPVKGFNILAGYSYNNMRYTKTKKGKGYFIEGERLVNTPVHTANISLIYTYQQGLLKGLKFGLSSFYTGKRFGGWNNTQSEPQLPSRLIAVKGFSTMDLSAGYTYKKISFVAKVSNLFSTLNYYVHENYSINPIPPAQFICTTSVKL